MASYFDVRTAMIIKSFVLIEKDFKYLLIQEASYKWRGKWFLPGGRVKRGEAPDDAVIRETKEEAGCMVKLEGIFYIKCYEGFFTNKLHIFYTGSIMEDRIKTYEDRHSMGARWFTFEEIKNLPVRQKMLKILERHRKYKGTMSVKNFKLIFFRSALKKLM
jgi:8-oxo-dGTP diphosphatase